MTEYGFLRFLDLQYELLCFLVHQCTAKRVAFTDRELESRAVSYLYSCLGCLHQIRDPLWKKYERSEIESDVMNCILCAAREAKERVEC